MLEQKTPHPFQQQQMIDLNGEAAVQVEVDDKGTLWVNVNGICRFRSQGHLVLEVNDKRIDSPNCLVNPDFLIEDVLNSVMMAMGWDGKGPTQKYMDEIAKTSVYEVMDRFLMWNGIIGWTPRIIEAFKSCLSSSTMDSSGGSSTSTTSEPSSTIGTEI